MAILCAKPTLLLALGLLLGPSLAAQDDAKWCRIVNKSDSDYTWVITDRVPVGKFYFRELGKSDVKKISSANDAVTLKSGTTYEFQTETSFKSLNINARIGIAKVYTDLTFTKSPTNNGIGLKVDTLDASTCPVTIDVNNYLVAGKTFLILE